MPPLIAIDRDGLWIGGQRFFLLAGCLHYFRYPCAEWPAMLETLRAGGLNTVDTVIPWNRHEPQPGRFDFADEADLPAFLDLCAAMALYVIVRPGPYICAEWENGGLPAWLTAREGLQLRVDDPAYLAATLRWFDVLLPMLAERQITRGGPIILCQIENEHWASGRYGHDGHQRSLAQAAIERGIEIPQYTCVGATRDWPEFRNGWNGIAEKLLQTRQLWPENPLMVSELWSGWFDHWGAARHNHKSAAHLDVTLHQLAAVGASGISHWMWAGGTNFGYWGGRTVGGDAVFTTTSYDYDAPVSEYGELRNKFRVARRHHLFLSSLGVEMAPILADALPGGPQVIGPAAVRGRSEGGSAPYRNLRAAADAPAAWHDFSATYLHNPTQDGQVYQLFLQKPHRRLSVPVEAGSMRPVFCNLPLAMPAPAGVAGTVPFVLCYHSGRILGGWWQGARLRLVCYGQPGEAGEMALRGPAVWQIREATPEMRALPLQQDLALHYWIGANSGRLLAACGEYELELLLLDQGAAECYGLAASAQAGAPAPRRIALAATALEVAEQVSASDWQALLLPTALEHLGCALGYGWYRAEFELDQAVDTTLAAPWLSDRGTLLIDGGSWGIFGVQPGQSPHLALPLLLPAGRHELRLLVDNLGRFNYGSLLGERKGLLDTLYWGGRQEDLCGGWVALWQEALFAGEALARARPATVRPDAVDVRLDNFAFSGPAVWLLREFVAQPGMAYVLHMTGDRNPGALFVNGRELDRFSRHRGGGLIKHDISDLVQPGVNVLALHIQHYAGLPWRATLLEYDPARALQARWSFRPGLRPAEAPAQGELAFHRLRFSRGELNLADGEFLKLRIGQLGKGQIWLNGRNLGRFWQIGPQDAYKVPVSWLQDENELLIFAEAGRAEGLALEVGASPAAWRTVAGVRCNGAR
jgi:beta-galactosidase